MKPYRAVFYLPGVYGDEPKQEALRGHLADRIKFTTLSLPDIGHPVEVLCSLPATAQFVTEKIINLQQEGEIYIVGFSFGANLAVEVASQLTSAGRSVAYLGLIDGPLNINGRRHTLRVLIQLLLAPRAGFILYDYLIKLREKLIGFFIKKRITASSEDSTISDYRFSALRRWKPKICETKGILILSITFFERSSASWKAICPNCKQVKIRSNHHNMLLGTDLYRISSLLANDLTNTPMAAD